jgi:hypothetical protein
MDIRWIYADIRAETDQMTELIPDSPHLRKLFQALADAAIGWDGSNPYPPL